MKVVCEIRITLKTDGLKRYNWNIAVTKAITNSYYTT